MTVLPVVQDYTRPHTTTENLRVLKKDIKLEETRDAKLEKTRENCY